MVLWKPRPQAVIPNLCLPFYVWMGRTGQCGDPTYSLYTLPGQGNRVR